MLINVARDMTKEAGMIFRFTLDQRYITGDLLWEKAIDLVHYENIYFWCKVYLPYKTKFIAWVVLVYYCISAL